MKIDEEEKGRLIYENTIIPVQDMMGDNINGIILENQLMKYAEDLSSLYHEIKRLRKKTEKLDLFTRSVTHDLKNLTIGAHGFSKLLDKHYRQLLDSKGKNFLDRILESSAQSTELVESINAFTRSQKTPLHIEAVDLRDIIQVIKNEYSEKLEARRIQMIEAGPLSAINADRLSILRIIRNLLDNSLKYGGEELSKIVIEYMDSGDFHVIIVRDDGIGIESKDADKIFDKFYRNESAAKIEGLGLGLSIVKDLAKRHKGKVWIESYEERGATFCISIYKKLVNTMEDQCLQETGAGKGN